MKSRMMLCLMPILLALPVVAQNAPPKKRVETIGGLVQVSNTKLKAWQVLVDGKSVFVEQEGYTLRIVGRFPDNSRAEVLLLATWDGGVECPSLYRILRLRKEGPTKVSEQFGNCSDIPSVGSAGEIIQISFPSYRGSPASRWVYDLKTDKLRGE